MPDDRTAQQASGYAASATQSKRILVVDDEKQVLTALVDLLENDFEVITESSPQAALEIAEADPSLAVILCDQRMPRITGDELLARAREYSFATRVLITGYADFDAVVRAINDGKVFAYVSKPWDPTGLKMTVHRAAEFYALTRQLAEEKAFMAALMSNSADAIYIKDLDQCYLRANEAEARVLGAAGPGEIIGLQAGNFVSPDRRMIREKEESRLMTTGEPVLNRVEKVTHDDGTTKWFAANKAAIRDEKGRVTGLVGITRDITEQMRDREQLDLIYRVTEKIAAAASIEAAIESVLQVLAPATGWDIGEAWTAAEGSGTLSPYSVHFVSDDSLDGFVAEGKTRTFRIGDGIPGRVWQTRDVVWVSNLQESSAPIVRRAAAQAHGIRSGLGIPVLDDDGEILATLVFFSRHLRNRDSQAVSLARSVADQISQILARKLAEEKLRSVHERFQKIIEEASHGVFVHRDFELLYVNKAFAAIFGYDSPEEAMREGSIFRFLHPDEHDRVREFGRARAAGKAMPIEYDVRGLHKNGTEILLENRVAPVPWEGGKAICGNFMDVTRERAMRQQLAHAQKMDALGQLTGGIAHDFNNLLTVIGGNLELLSRRTEEMEDVKLSRWVDTARSAATRGGELTARLLAFSRRQVLEPQVLEVNRAVLDIEDMLSRSIGEHIEITVSAKAAPDQIRVDPGQLENALLNLAVNARDAMPDGGRLIIETGNFTIKESYATSHGDLDTGNYVMIAVTDTGTGMTEDVQERAFEPFFTTKSDGKGTGLGLAMIYGFIKQSGGHINLYSEAGQGTTFRLYLPVHTGTAVIEPDAICDSSGGGKRILVVEDNPDVRETALNLLDALGYDVVPAGSGPEALALLEADATFDLLFTDMVMPGGMTGVDLAREAKARWPNLRILYTSGYAEEALRKSGGPAPDGVWIAKPYSRSHLGKKVREALGGGG